VNGTAYASGGSMPSAAAVTISGAGVANLTEDTALELTCLDGYATAQQWDITELKITALTLAR
jgi:hypothetical protein